VAVRVVSQDDELLAVFCGQLDQRSDEKHPALFWPPRLEGQTEHPEKPGVYLHPERFEDGALHWGGFVLEVWQDGIAS
jgi:hypothetical protein